jgi:hypothetical protein
LLKPKRSAQFTLFNLARTRPEGDNVAIARVPEMLVLLMILLLVVLPYGTALICGALTYWAGAFVSGWSSVGGLALGIYFFHKCMELLTGS